MNHLEATIDFFKRYTNALDKDPEYAEFLNIINPYNIEIAHTKARRNKGHYKEVQAVNADSNLIANIYEMLVNNTYEVSPYKTTIIKDPKERVLLKLPYYPDRIIQWVIMQYLEPILMETYHSNSCASIKGRGIDAAFNLAKSYTQELQLPLDFYKMKCKDIKYYRFKQQDYKYSHCLKIDIRHFYQSIPHSKLKEILSGLKINKYILQLLYNIIDSSNSVPENISKMKPGYGLPIGSYVSQHLANLYLTDIDNWLDKIPNCKFVRYMDDFVIFCNSHYCHEIRKYLVGKLEDIELQMKDNWQVYNLSKEGIDFVGYRFCRHRTKIRNTTRDRMIKNLTKQNEASYWGVAKRAGNEKFCKKYFTKFASFTESA